MQGRNDSSGVSNCYIFRSRLQEYAQKAGITTPVYETVKEGLSHEPVFRSSVIVNGVRYDSLPGFFNRKAAEQSAAEVALQELMRDGRMADCIPNPMEGFLRGRQGPSFVEAVGFQVTLTWIKTVNLHQLDIEMDNQDAIRPMVFTSPN